MQVGSKRVNVMMAQKRQAAAGEALARGAVTPLQPQPLYHELTNGVAHQPVSIPPGMSFFPARGYASLNGASYPQVSG